MKKVIALAAIILGGATVTSAQNGVTVRIGASFPVGTFSQGTEAKELALSTPEATFGGAGIGFNAGLKYQIEVVKNLGIFATADFFYNGLNKDAKNDIKKEIAVEGIEASSTIPSYMNVPVMLGLNYSFLNIRNIALWAEAGAGVNLGKITKMATEINAEVPLIGNINGSTTTTYDMSTTFAWQAGVGVCLGRNLSLGVHYYNLGSSVVNSETAVDANVGDFGSINIDNILGENGKFTTGKLNPSMIVARLGYTF